MKSTSRMLILFKKSIDFVFTGNYPQDFILHDFCLLLNFTIGFRLLTLINFHLTGYICPVRIMQVLLLVSV